ncbi:MAG: ferrochelatase [Candidatus Rokubacteria bacterium 13_1_40CM_2_68_8]|nr:MAG: ferrochelatase [Candidatus Rokubacteria bacterium 13_1_40CM_2_68_8]
MSAVDSVLLVAFGGPTAPHEIRPFLEIVTRGRSISAERLEEVVHHYKQMPGGRSPLAELTFAQARGLEQALARAGPALPVFVGMRNWHPFLHETLAEMAGKGARRTLGIILSPLRTEASWERYMQDVAEARARVPSAPEVGFAPAWFEYPRFVAAVADRTRAALDEIPRDVRASAPLVFTAHSVPVAMADASPYVSDLTAAARAVTRRLAHSRWSIAYQSRSGSPREPWLEPDVAAVVQRLAADGARHAVVVPIGFVCDHVEVLYDLDVEVGRVAAAAGLSLHRAAAVNDHPEFIAMLADLVRVASGRR